MRFSRVYHKKLYECDKKLLNQFKRLNFGEDGMMRDLLEYSRIFIDSYVFYIMDYNSGVAAWALCCRTPENINKFVLNIYVKKKYRRKGLGKRIIRYVDRYSPKLIKSIIEVLPHDFPSDEFFSGALNESKVFRSPYG